MTSQELKHKDMVTVYSACWWQHRGEASKDMHMSGREFSTIPISLGVYLGMEINQPTLPPPKPVDPGQDLPSLDASHYSTSRSDRDYKKVVDHLNKAQTAAMVQCIKLIQCMVGCILRPP